MTLWDSHEPDKQHVGLYGQTKPSAANTNTPSVTYTSMDCCFLFCLGKQDWYKALQVNGVLAE